MNVAPAWPDLAGRIEGGRHRLPVRVYFEDTDFSGLAYHGSFVRWCERGRSDWLRLLGVHHHELINASKPAAFVVRRLTIDYLKPARIDETLEVVSSLVSLTAATLTLSQQVQRERTVIASAEVLVVLIDSDGRPARMPARLKAALGGAS